MKRIFIKIKIFKNIDYNIDIYCYYILCRYIDIYIAIHMI